MESIQSLLEWAAPQGVRIRGIQPQMKPNRGIGMTATKNLQKGDVLITVPMRAVRGLETVSALVRVELPPKMSVHGLLAADFVLNPPSESWVEVVPTMNEFRSMPFFWPEAAQKLLPGAAKRLLKKQQSNIKRDWEHFHSAYAHIAREDYVLAWFIVNTRAFYQETELTIHYPWEDRLALLPIADLFNHAVSGCTVSYGADGYEVIADRKYFKGDEVCTSYGEHSNDFLLAEYGFILQNNTNDRFDPEYLISSQFNAEEIALLKQMKTQPALRRICRPTTEEDGIMPNDEEWFGDSSLAVDKARLREILGKVQDQINKHQSDILALGDGEEVYQKLLQQRWDEIDDLVRKAIQLSTGDS